MISIYKCSKTLIVGVSNENKGWLRFWNKVRNFINMELHNTECGQHANPNTSTKLEQEYLSSKVVAE